MASDKYHDHLRQVPLFAGLDADELDAVGRTATELEYPAGHALMREGSRAHEMFVILEGEVSVTKGDDHVADVGVGQFVGEMALLNRGSRNSTVTSNTDVVVLHIDGREFTTLLERVPSIAVKMLPVVAARVIENSDHHSH